MILELLQWREDALSSKVKKDNCWSEQSPAKSTVPFFGPPGIIQHLLQNVVWDTWIIEPYNPMTMCEHVPTNYPLVCKRLLQTAIKLEWLITESRPTCIYITNLGISLFYKLCTCNILIRNVITMMTMYINIGPSLNGGPDTWNCGQAWNIHKFIPTWFAFIEKVEQFNCRLGCLCLLVFLHFMGTGLWGQRSMHVILSVKWDSTWDKA